MQKKKKGFSLILEEEGGEDDMQVNKSTNKIIAAKT